MACARAAQMSQHEAFLWRFPTFCLPSGDNKHEFRLVKWPTTRKVNFTAREGYVFRDVCLFTGEIGYLWSHVPCGRGDRVGYPTGKSRVSGGAKISGGGLGYSEGRYLWSHVSSGGKVSRRVEYLSGGRYRGGGDGRVCSTSPSACSVGHCVASSHSNTGMISCCWCFNLSIAPVFRPLKGL